MPFVTNLYSLLALIWGYLFFGGILVPVITPYMLNSIEEEAERAIGNAAANVLYYGLGYLPAPWVWGMVNEYTGGTKSVYGFVTTLGMNIPAAIMLAIAMCFRPKHKIKINVEDKDEIMEEVSP